jgi:hypothetical protein
MNYDYEKAKMKIFNRYREDKLTKREKKIIKLSWAKGHPLEKLRDSFRENPIWSESRNFDSPFMNKMVLDAVRILKFKVV